MFMPTIRAVEDVIFVKVKVDSKSDSFTAIVAVQPLSPFTSHFYLVGLYSIAFRYRITSNDFM